MNPNRGRTNSALNGQLGNAKVIYSEKVDIILTVDVHPVTKQEGWRVFLVHPIKKWNGKTRESEILHSSESATACGKPKSWRVLLRTPSHAAQTDPVVALGHMLEVTAQALAEQLHRK
jgi:hypothetical protein